MPDLTPDEVLRVWSDEGAHHQHWESDDLARQQLECREALRAYLRWQGLGRHDAPEPPPILEARSCLPEPEVGA